MTTPIGYYVHHHGSGHRDRAVAIAALRPDRFVLLGTGLAKDEGGVRCVNLDDDRPGPTTHVDVPSTLDCLHYAPQHHAGVLRRVARLTAWMAHERPSLLVVDVSVEIAMLARLASVPTVYVRLSGLRDDTAHRQAFHAARALMAPFHHELDAPSLPDWVRDKTRYLPGLTVPGTGSVPAAHRILFVNGRGGGVLDGTALAAVAASMPQLSWRVIGPATPPLNCPPNLTLLGWVEDAADEIAKAGVVIGSAGDGVVNAVLAAARPYVCLPQPRPYAEQWSKARRLGALGAAVVLEDMPAVAEWPSVLDRARRLNPAVQARLHDPEGRLNACNYLCALADR